MKKFRKGDRVSLEAEVTHVYPADELVEVLLPGGVHADVKKAALTVVKSTPAPGDTVIHENDESRTYTVMAVDGDVAWVKREGGYLTFKLASLLVVDRA